MMTIEEALAVVVARTGHARYRDLCDPSHPDNNPGYIPVVLGMAASLGGHPATAPTPAAARPDVAEAMALAAAMKACPSRSVDPGCGCSGARCLARGGAVVTHLDCFPCLQSRD